MSELPAIAVILGTFLPLLGIAVTLLAARRAQGPLRWGLLAGVPAATLLACWLAAGPVMRGGNLLAATLYLLYALSLVLYYPALAVLMIVAWRRAQR